MLLRFLRFIRGYVCFTVRGKFPERFLNIMSKNGIRLWDVERHGETLTAAMYMKDYRRIRPTARACRVTLRMSARRGLPTYVRKYRDRIGIFVGAFVFILTVFIMSLFIWSVDITGLDTISEYEMRFALREHGLYVGAFKPTLDYRKVSRSIMLDMREVGWMAVNVTGSYASVEVKEEYEAPEVTDIKAPSNVKAKRDGTIIRIEAHEGDTILKEGSGVVKGQLVVSGVMSDDLGGVRLVHADAKIIARTHYDITFSMPKHQKLIAPDGEVTERYSVNIMGLKLPLTLSGVSSEYFVIDRVYESPVPLDTTLPMGRIRERISALSEREVTIDNNSAEEILQKQAQLYECFTLAGCTVIDRIYEISETDEGYTLTVSYTCEEDIAYTEDIGTDENTYRLRLESDEEEE